MYDRERQEPGHRHPSSALDELEKGRTGLTETHVDGVVDEVGRVAGQVLRESTPTDVRVHSGTGWGDRGLVSHTTTVFTDSLFSLSLYGT